MWGGGGKGMQLNIMKMKDGTVVSDYSSLCFTSTYQPKYSRFCENCKTLKCETSNNEDLEQEVMFKNRKWRHDLEGIELKVT